MPKANVALPRYQVRYAFCNDNRSYSYSILVNAANAAAAGVQVAKVMKRDGYPMDRITILGVELDALT